MSDAPIQTGRAARISLWFAAGTPGFVLLAYLIAFAVNGLGVTFGLVLFAAPVLHLTGPSLESSAWSNATARGSAPWAPD